MEVTPGARVGEEASTSLDPGARAGEEASAPLNQPPGAPAYTVDAYLALARHGKDGRWPGSPTWIPLITLGTTAYGMGALLILQPTLLDGKIRDEFFFKDNSDGDNSDGEVQLAAVGSAFFVCWGLGTFAISALADRIGRKKTILWCAIGVIALTLGCSLAPSFAVYAGCRALLGAPVGAIGAVTYVLIIEWALPADNALLTSLLMAQWSCCAVFFVGLVWVTDTAGLGWRNQLQLLALCNATTLVCLPCILESPRYYLSRLDYATAEANLGCALKHSRIVPPDGSTLSLGASGAAGVAESVGRAAELPVDGVASSPSSFTSLPQELRDPMRVGKLPGQEEAETVVEDAVRGGEEPLERPSAADSALTSPRMLLQVLLVGYLWLAVSVLFYGLDFTAAACDASSGCNPYVHAALTSVVDVPGYFIGSILADLPVVGRRLTASASLVLGGTCLLLMPLVDGLGAPRALADALSLSGKLCASSGFVQAYLFPAELFATSVRGSAIGIANIFARAGTTIVPLLTAAPAVAVQLGLGTVALSAGLSTLLLPERQGMALPE